MTSYRVSITEQTTEKCYLFVKYTELTSLKMAGDENVIDYILRAEKAATSLKTAGETISDSLLIAMILKGLPRTRFKSSPKVVTQKDKEMSFGEFKVALRSFEETEKLFSEWTKEDTVMKVIVCYECGKPGHKQAECRMTSKKPEKKWCDVCKNIFKIAGSNLLGTRRHASGSHMVSGVKRTTRYTVLIQRKIYSCIKV